MGFWGNLFGNNQIIEQPPLKQGVYFFGEIGGKSKVLNENFLEWYKTNPFVFTAINERSKAVANAKFYIKTKDGEFIENDLTRKLNKPNPYLSKNEFLMQLMTYKGIWGTGYLYLNKLRASSQPNETDFLNLPTNQIQFNNDMALQANIDYIWRLLTFNQEDNLQIYYCSLDALEKKQLDKNNLLPFFDSPIFTNPYYSESRLKSQRYVVSNIQAALESQNTFLSTPGGIGMIMPDNKDALGVGQPLRDEEKEEVERQIQQDYGSLTGQRNLRLINSPVKYQETMVDVSKLKITESLTQNALILFGAFGLPKELLTAMLQGSTFENQKTAYKNYIQTTAQTEADSIANSLNIAMPSREGELVAKFDHMPIMQENEKERATVDKTNAEAQKIDRETWDLWLANGYVNEAQYKEHFNL
jgi:HK97 family phage portal protein